MKGLITFIDILGYQSFLENNSATDSALRVLKLVTDLPKSVDAKNQKMWREFWEKNNKPEFTGFSVEHLIFSDTIVLLYKYPSDDFVLDIQTFAYFTVQSMELMAELFVNGLPSRGVIHQGEFIIEGTCFAGKGIVEAYKTCSKLDFSGIVLTDKLDEWLVGQGELRKHFVFADYLAPFKDGKESRAICLNWYSRLSKELRTKCDSDVIQFVSESFWAHGKDLPINTDSKIRNTCKILRKFRSMMDSSGSNSSTEKITKGG